MSGQDKLTLGGAQYGKAVFAAVPFAPGDEILEFQGELVERHRLPAPYEEFDDRFLQIGASTYLGPSGGLDDYINHSCDPNGGIRVEGTRVSLLALRPILAGEEITFDYSTTMNEDDWELECGCGSSNCRGFIKDFKRLPKEIQDRYLALSIVPEYNRPVRK